jgi:hypothetical protein
LILIAAPLLRMPGYVRPTLAVVVLALGAWNLYKQIRLRPQP